MPAPVVIKLQVDGVDRIRDAFKSIEDIVSRSENVVTNTTKRGSQARKTEAEREARGDVAEFALEESSEAEEVAERLMLRLIASVDAAAKGGIRDDVCLLVGVVGR